MSEFVQIEIQFSRSSNVTCAPTGRSAAVFWLQGITLIWMLVECSLSLYAAAAARSPAMLAFGSDSFVELLSAGVVLLQFLPQVSISQRNTARVAGALLFALAFIVCVMAIGSLALRLRPETSRLGIGITVAAQTDPLPNVVGRVGWSSFRRMAVWPNIGLSSYSPVRRWAAAIVSDFEDVDQQIQRIQSGTARYMDCSPQPQAD